jgi:hypothetical protein
MVSAGVDALSRLHTGDVPREFWIPFSSQRRQTTILRAAIEIRFGLSD